MTDYATPETLLKLPLRKFEHFRVSTHDAPPTPLHEQASSCQVCRKNASRYTCPRCDLPYCSVKCYQDHCKNSDSSTDSPQQQFSCTEAFYHDRVADVLRLEQKAKTKDTHSLIRRAYHNNEQNNLLTSPMYQDDNENEDDDLSEEELAHLLEMLTVLEQGDDTTLSGGDNNVQQEQQQEKLMSLLAKSPKLKAAFEASLEKGEIQQIVLKPWNPWWRPVLSSNNTNKNSSENDYTTARQDLGEDDNECIEDLHNNLDERLLKVPPLQKLQGRIGKPLPDLTSNLLEVLYHIAYTLRLYHGKINATADGETALDAAMVLLQSSTVLNQDARYERLEEVMLHIVSAGTIGTYSDSAPRKGDHQKNDTISWTIVAQDVAYLVANPRLVGRALLEALDIIQAAITYLKNQLRKQPLANNGHRNDTDTSTAGFPDISGMRRKRKKLEFFLSWSQCPNAYIPAKLSEDIRVWVEHWKAPETNDHLDAYDALESVLLPPTLPSQKSTTTAAFKETANSEYLPPIVQEVRKTRIASKIQVIED